MSEGGQADLAALLRARLAAAGLEPPDDTTQLERDLALHLERVDGLTAAADLHPSDPPLPDPTRWSGSGSPGAGPGDRAAGRGAVDDRSPLAPGWATLPEGAPIAAGQVGARPEPAGQVGGLAEPAGEVRARARVGEVGGRPEGADSGGGLGEQARLVREGEVTSVELVERALERIERLDPEVGAFVLVLGDQALAEAAERDAERRRGRAAGVLHGVPVAVKDLVDMAGVVTGAGSVKLAGNRAAGDAEVVARLRRAGAVVVGKTRTNEFAYGVTTPGTANPWDPERIAGGSSGGSAAAVAAGLVAGAIGSDTAGSIRIPSSCCGVVGLKPTWGRVPATGVWPLSWSCDHVGPIAATVADVALLDEVLAGEPAEEGGRPAVPSPRPDPPRIGRVVGDDLGPVDPGVAGVLDELCRGLEAAGAVVDKVTLPLAAARGAVGTIVLAEAAAAHARLLAETGEDGYSRAMLAMIRIGRGALAGEYLTGLRYRGRFAAEVEGLLAGRDALLLPTLPCAAPLASERTVTIDGTRVGVQAALTRLPGPFNCSGSPVLSLPTGLVDGLPVGVSLVGRIGGDRALLSLAAWVEAVAPGIGRPAIHA
jgi:aspartyl-tRNA(Asn)/glutamyl-tRNA(Gln) amidotransferase subunit A